MRPGFWSGLVFGRKGLRRYIALSSTEHKDETRGRRYSRLSGKGSTAHMPIRQAGILQPASPDRNPHASCKQPNGFNQFVSSRVTDLLWPAAAGRDAPLAQRYPLATKMEPIGILG